MPKTNVIIFKFEKSSAKLRIVSTMTAVLTNVFSQDRQKGHGNAVMQKVIDYCDSNKLNVILVVGRYGYSDSKALNNAQLVTFYEKFGFIKTLEGFTKGQVMRRSHADEFEKLMPEDSSQEKQ